MVNTRDSVTTHRSRVRQVALDTRSRSILRTQARWLAGWLAVQRFRGSTFLSASFSLRCNGARVTRANGFVSPGNSKHSSGPRCRHISPHHTTSSDETGELMSWRAPASRMVDGDSLQVLKLERCLSHILRKFFFALMGVIFCMF